MQRILERFSLPLLTKDLLEQSARPRLFVVRIIYTLLLIGFAAGLILPKVLGQQFTGVSLLGVGQQIYLILIGIEFGGLFLFLPSLCCGVITVEKERNTLGLLFLTKLGPWTIIFEKLGSRLVLMFGLLLTSLPLLAFTYSLGGIELFHLLCGVWFLVLSGIYISSIAVMASAYFRTTVGAFLATYLIVFGLSLGPLGIDSLLMRGAIRSVYAELGAVGLGWLLGDEAHLLGDFSLLLFCPPGLCAGFIISAAPLFNAAYLLVFAASIPTLVISGLALWIAQMCLVPRAFLPPSNRLLALFKLIDFELGQLNERFTSGVIVVKEAHSLPDDRPIAWRETVKRSLGQFRYLVRILLVLEVPTLIMLINPIVGAVNDLTMMNLITVALWIIALLLIITQSATLVTGERARQTLDVLLTTPLAGREIILEKMSGIQRVIFVAAIPLMTCLIFQTWWRFDSPSIDSWGNSDDAISMSDGWRTKLFLWHEHFLSSFVTIIIYLNLVSWLSLWLGMRSKSPSRAILVSLVSFIAWCVLPITLIVFAFQTVSHLGDWMRDHESFSHLISIVSPVSFVLFSLLPEGLNALCVVPYLGAVLNALIYGSCWFWLRRDVLRNADRYLGRGVPSGRIRHSLQPHRTATLPQLEGST